jgi:hypothetical protein
MVYVSPNGRSFFWLAFVRGLSSGAFLFGTLSLCFGDLRHVQMAAGHSALSTAQRYIGAKCRFNQTHIALPTFALRAAPVQKDLNWLRVFV